MSTPPPPAPLRLGSLCSGYGGLDLAATAVFGTVPLWHAEVDPAAARVLAHRFPGVPNLGDITALNWADVPGVDVLAAGYPCQPFSYAGRRKGTADARHLWPHIAQAIRVLRPRLLLLENVPGHLGLGFDTVLGDLSTLGFDAEWSVLAASALGAAHQRRRLFLLAWPTDPPGDGRREGPLPVLAPRTAGQPAHPHRPPTADPTRLSEGERADQAHALAAGRNTRPLTGSRSLLPAPCATDAVKGGPNQARGPGRPALAAAQPHRWGVYATAITRHEHLAGRPSPEPTEPGPHSPRLAPRFTEWLMALPDGFVTAVPGLSRTDQLRILGNGVIPAHGEAAYRHLAARTEPPPDLTARQEGDTMNPTLTVHARPPAPEPDRKNDPAVPTAAPAPIEDAEPPVREVQRTGPAPDPAVYTGWLGKAALKLTETSEADPVAVLVTLMAAFGVMIGPGPYAQISDDRHPALLWPLILGHTGTGRKGTSLGVAARLIKAADPQFYSENVTSGLSSGEGLIAAVADDEDDPSGPKTRLVIETEYSVTMRRSGREGNSLSGVLRQAWEGDDLATLTRASLHATSPHIGILAHITPGEFRLCASGADMAGGTYNRFLPVYSERSKEIPDGEGAPENLVANHALVLRELVKKARDVRKVPLTEQARQYWADVVYGALAGAQPTDGTVAQFTARATPYARRAAMLYALGDGAAEVDTAHLAAAYALVGYARATAAHVVGTGTGDRRLDKLLTALDAAGAQGMTRSQVSDLFSRKLTVPQLDDLLGKAELLPDVTHRQVKSAGRSAEVWTRQGGEKSE